MDESNLAVDGRGLFAELTVLQLAELAEGIIACKDGPFSRQLHETVMEAIEFKVGDRQNGPDPSQTDEYLLLRSALYRLYGMDKAVNNPLVELYRMTRAPEKQRRESTEKLRADMKHQAESELLAKLS